jgi:hypothetical protein
MKGQGFSTIFFGHDPDGRGEQLKGSLVQKCLHPKEKYPFV